MKKIFISLLAFLFMLFIGTIMYNNINTNPDQIGNNEKYNYIENNINFAKFKGSLPIYAAEPELTSYNNLNYQKNIEDIEVEKEREIEKMVQGGCDKDLVIRNFVFDMVFRCQDGILFKTSYDPRLINNSDELKNYIQINNLISIIGSNIKYNFLNEYSEGFTREEVIRFVIAGWESVKLYLKKIKQTDMEENLFYFKQITKYDLVRKIKSITYPDFSILNDTKNDYLLLTHISFEGDDKKSRIIDHKLEKYK